MTTVSDILQFLNTIAPPHMRMGDWDPIGLNSGHADAEVTTVLVALDPFSEAIEEAISINAELLLTHHPLLFDSGMITDETCQGRRALQLIENKIAHICAHTNLDCAPGGVNDCLANALGLKDIRIIHPAAAEDGALYGLLRQGTVKAQSVEEFLSHIQDALHTNGLRYTGSNVVHYVAVGGGACGSELMDAYRAGCDTLVTADVKYNQFRDAYDLGMNLIDAGHFHTERPVCEYLASRLREAFPALNVVISNTQWDPMNFF